MEDYSSVLSDFMQSIPPVSTKLSLTNGEEFAKGIKKELGKYVSSVINPMNMMYDTLQHLKQNTRVYGSFLVHSGTLSDAEVGGIPVFLFKDDQTNPDIDRLLTPLSINRLFSVDNTINAETSKLANILYGVDSGLFELFPNRDDHIFQREFHDCLKFVGPLVKNVNSSFVNKITTVVKGDVLTDESYSHAMSLRVPVELFVDLESTNAFHFTGQLPTTGRNYIYYALCYLRTPAGEQTLSQCFFRSSVEGPELHRLVRDFYYREIQNYYVQGGELLNIKHMVFGALCRLGDFPESVCLSRTSACVRGASAVFIDIPSFVVSRGPWRIIL